MAALWFAAALLVSCAVPAADLEEAIRYVYTTSAMQAPPYDYAFDVDQFNPNDTPRPEYSRLRAIGVIVTGTIAGSLGIENTDPAGASFYSVEVPVEFTLYRPNGSVITRVTTRGTADGVLDWYDGVTDYMGPSGETFTVEASRTRTASRITGETDLKAFTGTKTIRLTLRVGDVLPVWTVDGKKTYSTAQNPLAGATLTIVYYYSVCVPGLYRAYINTVDKRTILDTCRARSLLEARTAFESRHPGTRIVSLRHIPDLIALGYEPYFAGVRTADARNVIETCYAQNPAQARRIIDDRHPGGVVNHLGLYPHNRRLDTWYAIIARPNLFEYLKAFDLREALQALLKRYPGEQVVHVVQKSDENAYRTFEGILDPKEVVERVLARSPEEASETALAKRPKHGVLDVRLVKSGDGIAPYEGTVHIEDGKTAVDTCPAASSGEARRILSDRYGGAAVAGLRSLADDSQYMLHQAAISVPGVGNVVDITAARNPTEARRILALRYPEGNVGSVRVSAAGEKLLKYRARVNTANGRTVTDACWAASPTAARKVFLARFVGGQVRSLSAFGANRPDEFEVTLKGTYSKERCEARDKAEAMRLLRERFPDANVVSVREVDIIPELAVYRANINTSDHRNIVDTAQAKSYSEAKAMLQERHPGSRFASLYRVTDGRLPDSYEGQIALPPARDTIQACSRDEALKIIQARYPRSGVTELKVVFKDCRYED